MDTQELEAMRVQCKHLQDQVKSLMKNESHFVKFVNEFNTSFVANVKTLVDERLNVACKDLSVHSDNLRNEYITELLMRDVRCQVLEQIIQCCSKFLMELMPLSVKSNLHGKIKTRYMQYFPVFMFDHIESICDGYEKEINGLQRLIVDVMQKWTDAQSHISELDRQVEDQLRLLYR